MTTGILNYGVGNLGSIVSMYGRLGIAAELVSDPAALERYSRFILPGVGAFDDAVERFAASGLQPALEELVLEDRRPLLGICLGMELLAESSEEGTRPGLGWVPGRVVSMRTMLPATFRLPYMGWGYVTPTQHQQLLPAADELPRFYFAHSYAFVTSDDYLLGTVDYGTEIAAIVGRDNVFGTQFHPEKSHRFGMELLRSFENLDVD